MAFTFLTPWLLAGIGLIAAPIVLHLLMRKQPWPLDFPALRFLQQRQETNRRTLRLRHLLLLAARCGAILLLAFALARPTFSGSGLFGDAAAPVAAAFVFDTSPRMSYRQDNQTRLEAARDIGLWMLTQLPPDSEVAVLDASTGGGDFAPDLIVAKQRVESLKPSPHARPFSDLLDTAFRLCKSNERKERGEVYLFTDLARAAWPERDADRLKALRAEFPQIAVYIVDVGRWIRATRRWATCG
ncbi:MAG: BatA domain-containing protein [Pirellulales bacterium]